MTQLIKKLGVNFSLFLIISCSLLLVNIFNVSAAAAVITVVVEFSGGGNPSSAQMTTASTGGNIKVKCDGGVFTSLSLTAYDQNTGALQLSVPEVSDPGGGAGFSCDSGDGLTVQVTIEGQTGTASETFSPGFTYTFPPGSELTLAGASNNSTVQGSTPSPSGTAQSYISRGQDIPDHIKDRIIDRGGVIPDPLPPTPAPEEFSCNLSTGVQKSLDKQGQGTLFARAAVTPAAATSEITVTNLEGRKNASSSVGFLEVPGVQNRMVTVTLKCSFAGHTITKTENVLVGEGKNASFKDINGMAQHLLDNFGLAFSPDQIAVLEGAIAGFGLAPGSQNPIDLLAVFLGDNAQVGHIIHPDQGEAFVNAQNAFFAFLDAMGVDLPEGVRQNVSPEETGAPLLNDLFLFEGGEFTETLPNDTGINGPSSQVGGTNSFENFLSNIGEANGVKTKSPAFTGRVDDLAVQISQQADTKKDPVGGKITPNPLPSLDGGETLCDFDFKVTGDLVTATAKVKPANAAHTLSVHEGGVLRQSNSGFISKSVSKASLITIRIECQFEGKKVFTTKRALVGVDELSQEDLGKVLQDLLDRFSGTLPEFLMELADATLSFGHNDGIAQMINVFLGSVSGTFDVRETFVQNVPEVFIPEPPLGNFQKLPLPKKNADNGNRNPNKGKGPLTTEKKGLVIEEDKVSASNVCDLKVGKTSKFLSVNVRTAPEGTTHSVSFDNLREEAEIKPSDASFLIKIDEKFGEKHDGKLVKINLACAFPDGSLGQSSKFMFFGEISPEALYENLTNLLNRENPETELSEELFQEIELMLSDIEDRINHNNNRSFGFTAEENFSLDVNSPELHNALDSWIKFVNENSGDPEKEIKGFFDGENLNVLSNTRLNP